MPRLRDITGNWFPDPILLADVRSSGGVPSLKTIGKFGYNPTVTTASFQDVWSDGGSLVFLTSAETMDIVSNSAEDDKDSGDGGRNITIEGLDNNFNEITETIDLEGLTPVTTIKSFIRINRVYCVDVGVTGVNEGVILIDATTASTRQASIQVGEGQSQKAIYTVPAGRTGYLTRFFNNIGKTDDALIRVMARENGKSWRIRRQLKVYQSDVVSELGSYITLPAKSDVCIQAKAITSTASVSSGFDMYITGR
jgi:hypothetical protein